MAFDKNMADGTPPGTGPESAPSGSKPSDFEKKSPYPPGTKFTEKGRPIWPGTEGWATGQKRSSAENPNKTEKPNPADYPPGTLFTRSGKPIFRVAGGADDTSDEEAPTGGFNQRPGVDNDGPQKTHRPHATDEERYRAENLGDTPESRPGGPDLEDPVDVNFGRDPIRNAYRERLRKKGFTAEQIRQLEKESLQQRVSEQSFYNMYQELEHYKNEGDFHRIRERVDNILATLDIDEAGDAPGINEMLQYMNIVFAEPKYEAFRSEVTNWIEARQITHSVAFAAKYLKCEQWGSGTTNIRGRHLKALVEGKAEKNASAILEEAAEIRDSSGKLIGYGAVGENYRRKAGETAVKEEKLEQILGNWGGDNGQYEKTAAGNPWTLLKRYKLVDQMWDDHGGDGQPKDFLGIDGAAKLAGLGDFPNKSDFYDKNGGFKSDEYDSAVEQYCGQNKDRIQSAATLAKEKYRKLFLYGMNKMIDTDPLDKNYSAYRAVNILYSKFEYNNESHADNQSPFTDLEGKKIVSVNTHKALEAKQQLQALANGKELTIDQLEVIAETNKLTPEEVKQLVSLKIDQVSDATLTDIEKTFVQLNRAFVIAEKIHHASGYSASSDGLRWKDGIEIPEELEGSTELGYLNRPGEAIFIDPVIVWDDPATRKIDPQTGNKIIGSGDPIKLHLGVDMLPPSPEDSDEVKKRKEVLAQLAKEKSGEIAKVWSSAYRNIYVKHSDLINYQDSKSGRGARDKKKLHHKPADYWDPGELNNGKFQELRKYGYVNTVTQQQFFGLGSNEQLAEGWDPFFNRIKYNVSRWTAMEKVQGMFDKQGPRLLYDDHALNTPTHMAKTLEDFMKASLALTEMVEFHGDHQAHDTEVTEFIQTLAKGLLEFRTDKHLAHKYHMEEMNYNEIDQLTRLLAYKHLVGHHDIDQIRDRELGSGMEYYVRASWHSLDKKKAIWGAVIGFIQEFSKQLGAASKIA